MSIQASDIRWVHAAEAANHHPQDGYVIVNGESVPFWKDGNNVWFYEQGKDGEDTLARFVADWSREN